MHCVFVAGAAAFLAVGGCVEIGSGKVLSFGGLEGRWAGTVSPTDPACGAERHGLMRISGDQFAFDPFGSTTIIDGKVAGDVLKGTLTRIGGGHRTLSITFEGRAHGDAGREDAIDGVLSSGSCTWRVALARA